MKRRLCSKCAFKNKDDCWVPHGFYGERCKDVWLLGSFGGGGPCGPDGKFFEPKNPPQVTK